MIDRIAKKHTGVPSRRRVTGGLLFLIAIMIFIPARAARVPEGQDQPSQARKVVDAAIQAMGGEAYLKVKSSHSRGRYFMFKKGRKAFARFSDWTAFKPVRWRFELGEGKRKYVEIYNLELEKGWTLEGKTSVEEIPEEKVKDFARIAKQDLDLMLRYRVDEEGMNLYYYGPDDIAGQGEHEAVEFLDATNSSVLVFFDRDTRLPAKLETHFTDKMGVRHKEEQELSNWHIIQGVKTPLRFDRYVDGEISSQRFLEEIVFDPMIPPEYFLRPKVDEGK